MAQLGMAQLGMALAASAPQFMGVDYGKRPGYVVDANGDIVRTVTRDEITAQKCEAARKKKRKAQGRARRINNWKR